MVFESEVEMNRSELMASGYQERSADEQSLDAQTVKQWLSEFPEWEIETRDGEPRLLRRFSFPDFMAALEYTNRIGTLAEDVNHHPVITLTWGKVTLQWWTHELGGLHQNDFVMAAESDAAYEALVD
jgi:4a-hydroxytetrahydrobiopterin dehydratase